ncbi:MAG: NUDIX hydrolase [Streptosporangiaceae bacterium]
MTKPETIRYTADVVCVRGDHVLLIERGWDPHKGLLALPGGHVDAGETAVAAAVRELAEETGVGVDAADLTLIGVYDRPDRDPRGPVRHRGLPGDRAEILADAVQQAN